MKISRNQFAAVFLSLWAGVVGCTEPTDEAVQDVGSQISKDSLDTVSDIGLDDINERYSGEVVEDVEDADVEPCTDDASCGDGNPCTVDTCTQELVCLHTPTSGDCDDGDPCTIGDQCEDGVCVPGEMASCPQGEICEESLCPSTCNGLAENCDRRFNNVSQVCTHNAYSSVEAGFIVPAPNQKYGLTRQLDDGVRCLMLDIYSWLGKLRLCHGTCEVGRRDLDKGLQEIKKWLHENPSEVVSLIVESYVSEEEIFSALVESGLADESETAKAENLVYFHNQEPGSPWPTLREMVLSGNRLVVFTDLNTANGTWNLDWRRYGWETPFDDDTFTCAPGRGDPLAYDNQIFILNHYTLCPFGGCTQTAEENNAFEFLYGRAASCWEEHSEYNPWGQIPTFINVDNYHLPIEGGFTNRPDVFDVAEALNALWEPAP